VLKSVGFDKAGVIKETVVVASTACAFSAVGSRRTRTLMEIGVCRLLPF
jgi:hypothetical protein